MGLSDAAVALRELWRHFAETVVRPVACIQCGGRVVFNGRRRRTASVRIDDEVVYIPEVLCRRVQCARGGCGAGWTVRPFGLAPRRHYQLDVVAHAAGQYLFDQDASQERVAREHDCSRRTVGRWLTWIAGIAEPAKLAARVAEAAAVPVTMAEPKVAELSRKARGEARRLLLKTAAWVLALLEALGEALALEPPGLRGVLERHAQATGRLSTYAAAAIPELARRTQAGLGEH